MNSKFKIRHKVQHTNSLRLETFTKFIFFGIENASIVELLVYLPLEQGYPRVASVS